MKKTIFIPLLLGAFFVSGCSSSHHDIDSEKGDKPYRISMSDETMKYREAIRAQHMDFELGKENYPKLIASLQKRSRDQKIPDVKTKNNLNYKIYNNEKVYTLDKGHYDNIVLYIHGGAYAYTIDAFHIPFCDKLVDELNAKVYMPLYPLAPQSTYKEAYDLLDSLYPELIKQNKPIYIMGDSAGGGLSLAYVEYLKNKGERLPDKMVLFSPFLDVTLSNPDIPAYEKIDLTLATYAPREIAKFWAGELDVRNPLISPLFGDLKGLPPTLLFVGTDEITYPDVTLLYNKMKDLGQDVSIVYGDGLWHVFVVSNISEAKESMKLIKDFVK